MPWNTVGERRDVRAQQPDDGLGAHAARGQGAREPVDLGAQSAVGRLRARRRVDQRDAAQLVLGQRGEEVVEDGELGISTSGMRLVNTASPLIAVRAPSCHVVRATECHIMWDRVPRGLLQ